MEKRSQAIGFSVIKAFTWWTKALDIIIDVSRIGDCEACSKNDTRIMVGWPTLPYGSFMRELDIGRAHITHLLKFVLEQPVNQRSCYQSVDAAKASATQLTFLDLSSAGTLC